jgi:hypothetical protein
MKTELIICIVNSIVAAKRTAICKLASLSASFACVSVFGMSLVNLPPSSSPVLCVFKENVLDLPGFDLPEQLGIIERLNRIRRLANKQIESNHEGDKRDRHNQRDPPLHPTAHT